MQVSQQSTQQELARKLGIACGLGMGGLIMIYAAVLIGGFMSLKSPDQPIGDPWFAGLEWLILFLAPLSVGLMAAINALAPQGRRLLATMALVFNAMQVLVTMAVHFLVLTVGRQPPFSTPEWAWLLGFKWPSIAYALDILAWDVFFPISVFLAAAALPDGFLARPVRWLFVASGCLALAGLSGVVLGDMAYRNIGIVGYAAVFPFGTTLFGLQLARGIPSGRD